MFATLIDSSSRFWQSRTLSPRMIRAGAKLLERSLQGRFRAEHLARIQERRLRDSLQYVRQRSPFYRKVFQERAINPGSVRRPADLRKLPFTTSADFRDWRRFLCVPERDLAALYTTSGTSGEPKRVYFTLRELQSLTNFGAVALRYQHYGRLVVLIALPTSHGLWIGSSFACRVVERAGGLPLPVGAIDPRETLRWMERLDPNVLISSPSYVTALTHEAQRQGMRRQLGRILVSGEPLTAEQKETFRNYWSAEVVDSYGTTELGGAQTLSFPTCTAFHLNDLHVVTEIVHPDTGEPAAEGELVFTTLLREAMPLVRYRSGDRGAWAQCACGLPFRAIHVAGRTDDMMVLGDMNLHGNVIAEAIGKLPGSRGRIAILIDKVNLTDRMQLSVDGTGLAESDVRAALLSVYPEIEVSLANGNLLLEIDPQADLRGQLKAVRIRDARMK